MKTRAVARGTARTLLGAAALAAWASCAAPDSNRVYLFAASSLQDALREVITHFEQDHPKVQVLLNVGSSNTLRRQIEQSDRADLFFSASSMEVDELVGQGLIDASDTLPILTSQLVVVAPASETGAGDWTLCAADPRPCLRAAPRLAVGQPDSVPAGAYARAWLEALGIWQELETRLVPTPNVRAAVAAVRSGGADLGIVYATDAARFPTLEVVYRLDPQDPSAPKILYVLAPLRTASPAAWELLHELHSPRAEQIYLEQGFGLARATSPLPGAAPTAVPAAPSHASASLAGPRSVRNRAPRASARPGLVW
jgi:molybdate transport system substrate-binding protein